MEEGTRRVLQHVPPVRAAARIGVLWRERKRARAQPRAALRYLVRGRELTNFTYDLSNRDALAASLAEFLGLSGERVGSWMDELESDAELRARLAARLATNPMRDPVPRYGKRLLYYAVVRWLRPTLVVETGTHDGLGAAVISRALERNDGEGNGGQVLTFDVNPRAGWLVDAFPHVARHVGATLDTLPATLEGRKVDMLIHDSLKRRDIEEFEFECALARAGPRLVLVTDEARATRALPDLAGRLGAQYRSFSERPARHFWPGNEIGIAVVESELLATRRGAD
jgi:predicted O-methyltransferase YrrM